MRAGVSTVNGTVRHSAQALRHVNAPVRTDREIVARGVLKDDCSLVLRDATHDRAAQPWWALVPQVTATLVTAAEPMVPEPFATVQVCEAGCVSTLTAYALPLFTWVLKLNAPLALTVRLLPALFCRTRVAPLARPDTVPPTKKEVTFVTQVTATLVTAEEAMVPEPFATVQVCDGDEGCVITVTA